MSKKEFFRFDYEKDMDRELVVRDDGAVHGEVRSWIYGPGCL